MNNHNFRPASKSEHIVFGAQRPGYDSNTLTRPILKDIQDWIIFMKKRQIKRVCCLLSREQLNYYQDDLLEIYRKEFGQGNICNVDIEDCRLCDLVKLKEIILPFLNNADIKDEPVVVHCSAGLGRTGHVLACWLVYKRGFSIEEALTAVKEMGRNPYEAINYGNVTEDELYALLKACMPSR